MEKIIYELRLSIVEHLIKISSQRELFRRVFVHKSFFTHEGTKGGEVRSIFVRGENRPSFLVGFALRPGVLLPFSFLGEPFEKRQVY
jgi:hypothetical protein